VKRSIGRDAQQDGAMVVTAQHVNASIEIALHHHRMRMPEATAIGHLDDRSTWRHGIDESVGR
jgi:hypothetical protein